MGAFTVSGGRQEYSPSFPTPAIGSLHTRYTDLPASSTCEVLVKVYASSVNPSDVSPTIAQYPKVLGSDVSGVVDSIGTGCTVLKVGDAVWGDIGANTKSASTKAKTKELGGYGEYVVALESQLGLKPSNVGFIEIGSMPKVALTSYKALAWYAGGTTHTTCMPAISIALTHPSVLSLFSSFVQAALNDTLWQKDPKVLILGGSGGCGTMGIQLAKAFGSAGTNVTTTTSADNFAYCKSLGADSLIDYKTTNWWDVIPDASFDVIYDTVGQDHTGDYAMKALKVGGYYVTITGQTAYPGKAKPGVHQAFFINSDTNLANTKELDALSALVAADKLRMPHIDGIFALADVAAAFKVSEGGQVKGKLSISVFNATAVAPAVGLEVREVV